MEDEKIKCPLALIPPVFNRFMKKHLDKWDKEMATEAEREIAKQFA